MKALSQKLLLLLFSLMLLSGCAIFDTKSFEAEKWRQGDIRERGKMVRSLEKSRILQDKTKPEVVEMLGKPDSDNHLSINYKVDIGYKFGSHPWLYSFSIYFDEKTQKVEKACLHD